MYYIIISLFGREYRFVFRRFNAEIKDLMEEIFEDKKLEVRFVVKGELIHGGLVLGESYFLEMLYDYFDESEGDKVSQLYNLLYK